MPHLSLHFYMYLVFYGLSDVFWLFHFINSFVLEISNCIDMSEKSVTVIITEGSSKSEEKFQVNETITVAQLKDQISSKIGKSSDRLKLTFRDQPMIDTQTVWSYVGLNNLPIYAAIGSGGSYAQKWHCKNQKMAAYHTPPKIINNVRMPN